MQKRGPPSKIGHSRGGNSTKIHAIVDAYGYPVRLMISEEQRDDITYAIPVLEQIKDMGGSQVLADKGYDSQELTIYMTGVQSRRSLPEKVQSLSVSVTGGFIKSAIWWKSYSLN